MEFTPYSVLMFIFAACILLAGFLVFRGETGLIRTFNRVKVKDKAAYVKFLGRSIMVTAAAPLLSGIAAFFTGIGIALAVLAAVLIAELIVIAKRSNGHY